MILFGMADEIRRHGPGVLIVMEEKQDRLRGCFFGNTWLSDVSDDHLGSVRGFHTSRQGQVSDVKRSTYFESADVSMQDFRKIIGQATDFQRVDVMLQQAAAAFHANRLTFEVKRNVCSDLGIFIDGTEVGMNRGTGDAIVLHGLEESEGSAYAFDIEVDEDVFRAAVS